MFEFRRNQCSDTGGEGTGGWMGVRRGLIVGGNCKNQKETVNKAM